MTLLIRWSVRQLLGSIRGRPSLKFSFPDVNKGLQVEFIALHLYIHLGVDTWLAVPLK